MQDGTDPPPGFVGTHDGTAANVLAERRVGRGGHAGRTMQRVHEAPGRHPQPETLAQQRRDFLERHARVLVQEDDERHRPRTQVHAGGAQRVGGLQGMPSLHAPTTRVTPPDLDVEAPDNRSDDGQILLILRRDTREGHHAPTRRARRGQPRRAGRIDARRDRPTSPASIRGAGAPTGRPPRPCGRSFANGTACRKPARRAASSCCLKALVLPLQPIAFVPRAHQFLAQARDLFVLGA